MELLDRLWAKLHATDFEELGYTARRECVTREEAVECCARHIQSFEDHTRTGVSKRERLMEDLIQPIRALHAFLYERTLPVCDAEMLTRRKQQHALVAMTTLIALGCLVANVTTWYLLGSPGLEVFAWAAGLTVFPALVTHLAYEHVLAGHKRLQALVAVAAALIAFAGLVTYGLARWRTLDAASGQHTVHSYVDDDSVTTADPPSSDDQPESRIHETLGESLFLIALAAELGLGLMFSKLLEMRHDPDDAAWLELKDCHALIEECQHGIKQWLAQLEIAKKQCMAGILRAEREIKKRRPPYHRAALILLSLTTLHVPRVKAQTIQHYEVILIDTSASVGKDGPNDRLFHQYLAAARKLLLTEPPNSRVWVLLISADSFGGTEELLNGWTPNARGVFTADLNRARHQLAAAFDQKSSTLTATAAGTDIFGGLWRAKVLLEPANRGEKQPPASRTIWFFSDMMNETASFPMPQLVGRGSEQMLERARHSKLLVTLSGYEIHAVGASTDGITPGMWLELKNFWEDYFRVAGAQLYAYSIETTAHD